MTTTNVEFEEAMYNRLLESLFETFENYDRVELVRSSLAKWGKSSLLKPSSEILLSGISDDVFKMGYFVHILQNLYHEEFKLVNITQGLYDTFTILDRLITKLESKIDYTDNSIVTYEMVLYLADIQLYFTYFLDSFLDYRGSASKVVLSTNTVAKTLLGKELSLRVVRSKFEQMYFYHKNLTLKLNTFKEELESYYQSIGKKYRPIVDFMNTCMQIIVSHEFMFHDKGYRYFSGETIPVSNDNPTYDSEHFRGEFINVMLSLIIEHVNYCGDNNNKEFVSIFPVLVADYVTMSLHKNFTLTNDGTYWVEPKVLQGYQSIF